MNFPQFASIPCTANQVASLLSYLDACGWEGDDALSTVSGSVQVKLLDEQDVNNFEIAMRTLNSYNSSRRAGTRIPVCDIATAACSSMTKETA
jgi:hypothetical protein